MDFFVRSVASVIFGSRRYGVVVDGQGNFLRRSHFDALFLRSAHRARKFTSQADKFTRNLERVLFDANILFG